MKKILILGALAGVGYYFYTKKTKEVIAPPKEETFPIPVSEPGLNPAIFDTYTNQVIEDADGYWMLVKDGRLYTPISIDSLIAWQKNNPDKPKSVKVTERVWINYGNTHQGGTF